jgi:hypothetical protein
VKGVGSALAIFVAGFSALASAQDKTVDRTALHVFAAQQTALGGRIVRTIGIVRARAKIGLQNLAYNIRRLVTLERIASA